MGEDALASNRVNDTSDAADVRYHELLRGMTPERRLDTAMKLSRGIRELAISGIRHRYPQAAEQEIRVRLAVLLYGRAIAAKLFGQVPDDIT